MKSPKVSIIVPVYNVEPYLDKCLESLSEQTLKEIEIIAVNDFSSDKCKDILTKYAERDNRIKVINKCKNEGTASARNTGLSNAQGEYIGFVDGDDYVDKNFYEKLYNLAVNKNADIAKGVTKTHNKDGSTVVAKDNECIVKEGKYAFMGHLLTGIYKRSLVENNKTKFCVDFFCFQIQVVYFANKIVCCDDVFYHYVRHNNSCDSDVFTIEKWTRLNLGHGNFMYDWVLKHDYDSKIKQIYLQRIKGLYFYGFNRLNIKDVPKACHILAENMKTNFNCGFDMTKNTSLVRKLYRKNKKTTLFTYIMDILKRRI